MERVQVSSERSDLSLEVWGVGSFENEAALTWVERLDDAADLEMLEATLEVVIELDEEGSVPGIGPSTHALAAAETIAVLAKRPITTLPEEVRQWCFDNPSLDLTEVKPKAMQALGVLLQDSSIRRFFEERGQGDDWEICVEELRDRLWS